MHTFLEKNFFLQFTKYFWTKTRDQVGLIILPNQQKVSVYIIEKQL